MNDFVNQDDLNKKFNKEQEGIHWTYLVKEGCSIKMTQLHRPLNMSHLK